MTIETSVVRTTAIVRLDRPEKRNAINAPTAIALSDALDSAEREPAIHCIVLSSTSAHFCAGTDVNEPESPATPGGGEYGLVRRQRRKPLIAAVEGSALGGGFELALSCDLVVAATGSSLGLPEVGLGVVATCGALFRAPRALPPNIARQLLLTGRPLPAQRLYELGFVNALTEPGGAEAEAIRMADEIASRSPSAVVATLRAVNGFLGRRDEEGWQGTMQAIAVASASNDFVEGRRAFLERRPPCWQPLPGMEDRT